MVVLHTIGLSLNLTHNYPALLVAVLASSDPGLKGLSGELQFGLLASSFKTFLKGK